MAISKREDELADSVTEALAHLQDIEDLLSQMAQADKEDLPDYREDLSGLVDNALEATEDVVSKLKALSP